MIYESESEDPTALVLQFIENEPDLESALVDIARDCDADSFVFTYCETVNRNRLQEPWPKWEAIEKDIDWEFIRKSIQNRQVTIN